MQNKLKYFRHWNNAHPMQSISHPAILHCVKCTGAKSICRFSLLIIHYFSHAYKCKYWIQILHSTFHSRLNYKFSRLISHTCCRQTDKVINPCILYFNQFSLHSIFIASIQSAHTYLEAINLVQITLDLFSLFVDTSYSVIWTWNQITIICVLWQPIIYHAFKAHYTESALAIKLFDRI